MHVQNYSNSTMRGSFSWKHGWPWWKQYLNYTLSWNCLDWKRKLRNHSSSQVFVAFYLWVTWLCIFLVFQRSLLVFAFGYRHQRTSNIWSERSARLHISTPFIISGKQQNLPYLGWDRDRGWVVNLIFKVWQIGQVSRNVCSPSWLIYKLLHYFPMLGMFSKHWCLHVLIQARKYADTATIWVMRPQPHISQAITDGLDTCAHMNVGSTMCCWSLNPLNRLTLWAWKIFAAPYPLLQNFAWFQLDCIVQKTCDFNHVDWCVSLHP